MNNINARAGSNRLSENADSTHRLPSLKRSFNRPWQLTSLEELLEAQQEYGVALGRKGRRKSEYRPILVMQIEVNKDNWLFMGNLAKIAALRSAEADVTIPAYGLNWHCLSVSFADGGRPAWACFACGCRAVNQPLATQSHR